MGAAACGFFHLYLQLHTFPYLVNYYFRWVSGDQPPSSGVDGAWGRNGASRALDLRRRGPADIWPQAPRGSSSPQASSPTFPQPPLPTPPPTPHGGSCSSFCLLCPSLISVMGSPVRPAGPQCTHSHTLYRVPRAHTHPQSPHTFTYTQKHNLHTPSHKAHTCAHIPVCPDTRTQLYLLTHSHPHIHTRLRLSPRTSLLRALLCPGHRLP